MNNSFENLDMINRVDKLRDNYNNPHEDPIKKLAEKENEFRDELSKEQIDPKSINKIADRFSNETLEKMEAEQTGHTDLLTGFSNKNSIIDNLPKILSSEQRKKQNCSLMMLDLDYFKLVNDTYGHEVGDLVLKDVSRVIKENLRESDFAFRYGGEEFVVFLMDSDIDVAQIVAEKIRKSVEDAEIKFRDKNDQEVILKKTLSIGCVDTKSINSWNVPDKDFDSKLVMEELIKKADEALYNSKGSGRNKVMVYNNLKK
ncbi:MAG TPA: GGDEF domain-containing protein [bacterium]|nr:GGDEF domain-containing protein [bacterium]